MISIKNIKQPTPMWAKWVFRGTMCFTTALAFYLNGSTLIDPHYKGDIILALKAIDMLIFGLSKMLK